MRDTIDSQREIELKEIADTILMTVRDMYKNESQKAEMDIIKSLNKYAKNK